jgi:uncharacterized protein
MPRVLITGGTGLIGTALTKHLIEKKYEVVYLSREENLHAEIKTYKWDVEKEEIDHRALSGVDYIIHLAGASIADKRWTEKRKKEIIESREKSARLLQNAVSKEGIRLKAFIGAAAVGIYGMQTSDHVFREEDQGKKDFLNHVCELWEKSYAGFGPVSDRLVVLRLGIVLSETNGALETMARPIKAGIGSALGTGKQINPWIHIEDLCRIFMKAIEEKSMSGVYNVAAPSIITNAELMKAIAETLHKPYFMPNVPVFVIRLMFGEMADMILTGSAVSAERIRNSGYHFLYTDVKSALRDLLLKK